MSRSEHDKCRPADVWSQTPMQGGFAMVKVFLVDDHEVVRRGIVELLGSDPELEVIGEAGSIAEAMARIPAARPDVAVLDVRLPDGSGVELCRDLLSDLAELRGAAERTDPLLGLTDQERTLLGLLSEGLTNKQIAARMFLAEKTVKNYVSRLLAKLGMERRTQAAVFASKLDTTNRPDR